MLTHTPVDAEFSSAKSGLTESRAQPPTCNAALLSWICSGVWGKHFWQTLLWLMHEKAALRKTVDLILGVSGHPVPAQKRGGKRQKNREPERYAAGDPSFHHLLICNVDLLFPCKCTVAVNIVVQTSRINRFPLITFCFHLHNHYLLLIWAPCHTKIVLK